MIDPTKYHLMAVRCSMLTDWLPETTSELLDRSDVAFLNGSWSKGSQLLWEAYANAIEDIAVRFGMPFGNDDEIRLVLQCIAIPERDYQSLLTGFYTVRRFRDAASNDSPEDYEVEFLYPEIRFIVAELAALA